MAVTGGHRLLSARWVGANAIAVRFESDNAGLHHQLYAGRSLVGVTDHTADREVVGQLVESKYPQELSLVAVGAADRLTDYGDTLGFAAWNKVRLRVSTSSYPADAHKLQITAGTEPGGAVDDENILGNIIFEGDGTYEFVTQPFGPSGMWHLEVTPYDRSGNAGTPLEASAAVVARPPDVVLQSDDTRIFGVDISGATLNLSVVLP